MSGTETTVGANEVKLQNDISRQAAIQRAKEAAKAKGVPDAKIDEVAQEFESVFLGQMLQHMFANVEQNELTGGGYAEDVYKSMMLDEYAKIISRTGGIGVADHVKREILKMQEVY